MEENSFLIIYSTSNVMYLFQSISLHMKSFNTLINLDREEEIGKQRFDPMVLVYNMYNADQAHLLLIR